MQDEAYMLVFQGDLAEGVDLERAKENLRELFKVSHDKVEQLFSLPAVVVKKNLTRELAQKFQAQLQQRGLITIIQPMPDRSLVSVAEDQMGISASASMGNAAPPASGAIGREQDESRMPMPFRFEGKAGEYFKIWIVNVLLSILTLGIYSAWAKVRNHRYFYSNSYIDKHSFEYLAAPITILKGRIVAAIFLAAYVLSGEFMPTLNLAFTLVFLVALPWLVCKSMAFRNRNTAFRNIRFGFDGTYAGAAKAFVLWPILGFLTFGILIPLALHRQQQFIVAHSRYGTSTFEPQFTAGEFYSIYLRALGILLLGLLIAAGVSAIVLAPLAPLILPLIILPFYLFVFAYVSANTTNLTFNSSTLHQHAFESSLTTGRLAWIYFSNAVVTALTLGLAIPWAKVRLANYHAECLTLLADGDIDSFVAAEEKNVSSLGEEIGDAFDMGIGM